jgi:superoxide dismutase, Fe-Mn family
MAWRTKNYDALVGAIAGLSEKQLRAHFELYEGYVKKLNEIEDKLKLADPKTANYSYGEISELLRRRSVAFNGAYLHELYFENLTGQKSNPGPGLNLAIRQNFGSLSDWFKQVRAGLISEPGWVLLCFSRQDGGLRNNLVSEHHIGVFAEQDIILAFDGWEHAYFMDYGTKKKDYISVLERSINWEIATKRFNTYVVMSEQKAA